MNWRALALAASAALLIGAAPAGAVIVTFDDLPANTYVPASYDGFSWLNNAWFASEQTGYQQGWHDTYAFPSPYNAAINSGAPPTSM